MNSVSEIEDIPEELEDIFNSPNGRSLSDNILDIKRIGFLDEDNNESSIIGMQIDNDYDNLDLTMYYDEKSGAFTYLIEEIDLGDGIFQINYLSPDGNSLFMQLEGPKEMMDITFAVDESTDPITLNEPDSESGRSSARCSWTSYFDNIGGCLDRLWATRTFKIVATAALFTGNGGYVAAGAVFGCGIGEGISCIRNWTTTSYNENCTNVTFCSRSVPNLTSNGSISFNLVTTLP